MLKFARNHDTDQAASGRFAGVGAEDAALPYRLTPTEHAHPADPAIAAKPKPTSPTLTDELAYINGIDPTTGQIDNTSYWGDNGKTAFKWGSSTLGTSGGTITYEFDPKSKFTATEKATFVKAMTLWSSVADVQFREVTNNPGLLLHRGKDGGEYTITPTTNGHGSTLGQVNGMAEISVDTSVAGFDLSGSFSRYGGYGLSSIIHEFGHLLGFGHGGDYNGNVDSSTQQFSAYDVRMYTTMSYIQPTDMDAKYYNDNPIKDTDWGNVQAPHTMMGLDIVDIQELYGVSQHSPFTGGQTYGFHSNISGVLHDFYDFTVNTTPVVTIFNQGTGNTLDLSGYSMAEYAGLASGSFSSVGGLSNNLFIDFSTQINHLITGSGADLLVANDYGDRLEAGGGADLLATGAGSDTMTGGAGNDIFYFYQDTQQVAGGSDVITDFKSGEDKIQIVIPGVTRYADLTIKSDGHGGSLISWADGEMLDVQGDKRMKSSDFVFGSSNVPAAFQAMLGSHAVASSTDLAALHYSPMFEHQLPGHLAIA